MIGDHGGAVTVEVDDGAQAGVVDPGLQAPASLSGAQTDPNRPSSTGSCTCRRPSSTRPARSTGRAPPSTAAHVHDPWRRLTGPSPVSRSRTGSNHHLLVDATGIPLAVTLTVRQPQRRHPADPRCSDGPHTRPVKGKHGAPASSSISSSSHLGCCLSAATSFSRSICLDPGVYSSPNRALIPAAHRSIAATMAAGHDDFTVD